MAAPRGGLRGWGEQDSLGESTPFALPALRLYASPGPPVRHQTLPRGKGFPEHQGRQEPGTRPSGSPGGAAASPAATRPAAQGTAGQRYGTGEGGAFSPLNAVLGKNTEENIFPANTALVCDQRDEPGLPTQSIATGRCQQLPPAPTLSFETTVEKKVCSCGCIPMSPGFAGTNAAHLKIATFCRLPAANEASHYRITILRRQTCGALNISRCTHRAEQHRWLQPPPAAWRGNN